MMDGPWTYDRYLDPASARLPIGSLRASDADREWTVRQLRQHLTEGRLEIDEFMERMDRAFQSRTLDDLERTLVDLPHPPVWDRVPPRRPAPHAHAHQRRPVHVHRRHGIAPLAALLFLLMLLTVIWPFWPVWMLVFWAAVVTFSHTGRRRHYRRHYHYW
jgi:hypothetical protein